jgi:hypothetical protein
LKKSVIWNISSQDKFPLEMWKHPKLTIELKHLSLSESTNLVVSDQEINIFYLRVSSKEWKDIKEKFLKNFELHPFISIIIISTPDEPDAISKELLSKSKFLVLENPIHLRELRIILDRIIQVEFYKNAAMEIGNGCLANVGFFEGVFSLAHKEYESKEHEAEALRCILDYEEKVKINQDEINIAMEKVNELKNLELIELHDRIRAGELLDQMRENELKSVIEEKKATERALEYSRIEEINQDKIIQAQDRLFSYTEKEILELLEENKKLKKQLGLS